MDFFVQNGVVPAKRGKRMFDVYYAQYHFVFMPL